MPYTLVKGLVWVLLALLIGIVIGWLLRSIAAKRQVERARAQHVDAAEIERLRGRVANLEPVAEERDRLAAELEACRADEGPSDPIVEAAPTATDAAQGFAAVEQVGAPVAPDVAEGARVLGRKVVVDDLKLVEGIGPKIEELCHGIGIRTWFDLSTTEVSLLATMLADAGPRFRVHDPGTWPDQAGLLAAGRWEEFKQLKDGLSGGRATS